MCHLRIAEQLAKQLNPIDEASFVYGNLGPDSGMPNADWTEFDPPKKVSHFTSNDGNEFHIRDLDFYRDHVATVSPQDNLSKYSFVLGYFAHLLCDGIWSQRIVTTTLEQFAQSFESNDKQTWDAVKFDWYALDCHYAHDNPDCAFWRVIMDRPSPESPLPFVRTQAFHHQLNYIRNFYSHPDPEWLEDRRFPYLNEATMARIVDDCVKAIGVIVATPELAKTPSHSALSLLPREMLMSYPILLGD